MRISVVIPAWNEGAIIGSTLEVLSAQSPDEVIVSDGGSDDATVAIARAAGARVVTASRGRAAQMNAGAAGAEGEVIVFLHADCRLPEHGLDRIRTAMADGRVVGGAFRLRLDTDRPLLRGVAALSNLRTALSSIVMGDRAIFVRATAFQALGGYRPLPLMEDVDLGHRLHRVGRMVRLREAVTASARRWEARGPLRTIVLMFGILWLWELGVSVKLLARLYPSQPSPGGQRADRGVDRRAAVITFAKAPDEGRVKTRLAATIGDASAVAVYRELGARVAATCRALPGARFRRIVAFSPADARARTAAWLGDGFDWIPQADGDLGARLVAAFDAAFEDGATAACAIGTDCVGFGPEHLERALAIVGRGEADVAIGPATDGGYWTIALAAPRPELFAGVAWSTERVLDQTLERARRAGLRVRLLETLTDVDRVEDLAAAGLAEEHSKVAT